MISPRPYLLKNKIQHYQWGTRGTEAFIPRFLGVPADPGQSYAELWIGAHPTASSDVNVKKDSIPLPQFISSYPEEILGKVASGKFSRSLPFLLKVLSAGEALSIQAHPNKQQAEQLHLRDPEHYPDENHKPEIAIALDSLTALIGFKNFIELYEVFQRYPELASFLGKNEVEKFKASNGLSSTEKKRLLREMYTALMLKSKNSEDELEAGLDQLARRLLSAQPPLNEIDQIFLELRQKYPKSDVGFFSIFLFNLIHLQKGQGIFIEAGIPHAYLKGNIVECMANSDNVIRAGLTEKYKDIPTLVDILTYESGPVPIIEGKVHNEKIEYPTAATEFQVNRINFFSKDEGMEETTDSLKILLVSHGEIIISWKMNNHLYEVPYKKGDSILIPAILAQFKIKSIEESELFEVRIPQET